jgi:hypothetical protein
VGARDEARLVADYERCGQHCCCKNFLKVLKPVSMRAAKVQKATLDPLKISGRCGRLMCCLRYEDQSYKELKARLPHKNKRVGTSEGPGVVIDSKILVQLVLVRLEHDMKEIAVPVEELMDPDACPKPGELKRQRDAAQAAVEAEADPFRGMPTEQVRKKMHRPERSSKPPQSPSSPEQQAPQQDEKAPRGKRRRDRRKSRAQRQDEFRQRSQSLEQSPPPVEEIDRPRVGPTNIQTADDGESGPRRKKRRRRRRRGGGGPEQQGGSPSDNPPNS